MFTSDGSSSPSLERTALPVGVPGRPFVISSQDGEIIYIPLSKSATRLLVTGKETDNAFAVVGSGGSQSAPIGFHYHRETHDVFLCLEGSINVWAADQCRTMQAGDFASVPPNTIHQYQILGPHSEFLGLIVPGGWEEFFRVLGEPYSGPMWPMNDERKFHEALLPRLKAAAERFDMVPCPTHPQSDPQTWRETENSLPRELAPYFLKNASGPAYVLGGMVCRPLATTAESGGKFAIGSVEGSVQHHESSLFAKSEANIRNLRFASVHHAFHVICGSVAFSVDSSEGTTLTAGEVVYVPKDTAFRLRIMSRFAKVYVFASGGGLVELLCNIGKVHRSTVLPETAEDWDVRVLEESQSILGFELC